MKPITGSDRSTDADQAGQQQASLQLTDQGRMQLASGRLDEAVSVFQKAIALWPNNPYAYYYLGQARYLRKEYSKGLPPLAQAELFLGNDQVWLAKIYALRGKTFEALSRMDEAREQYQKALDTDSSNPEAREGMERVNQLLNLTN